MISQPIIISGLKRDFLALIAAGTAIFFIYVYLTSTALTTFPTQSLHRLSFHSDNQELAQPQVPYLKKNEGNSNASTFQLPGHFHNRSVSIEETTSSKSIFQFPGYFHNLSALNEEKISTTKKVSSTSQPPSQAVNARRGKAKASDSKHTNKSINQGTPHSKPQIEKVEVKSNLSSILPYNSINKKTILNDNHSLSTHNSNTTITATSTNAEISSNQCKLETIKKSEENMEAMKSMIPWLNHTTEEELTRRHPNLPVNLTMQMIRVGKCHLMPSHVSISWKNTYWQEALLSNGSTFLAYSAIYDNRTETDIRPCVRILGVSMSVQIPTSWCHLWFNTTSPPVISEVQRVDYLDYQKRNANRQMPYLLGCRIPYHMAHLKPSAVSLVEKPFQVATTLLQVVGEGKRRSSEFKRANGTKYPSRNVSKEKSYAAAVCGPSLYYYHEDFSPRLVEWLEILRAQDISQVFLSTTEVHPNIEKVLRHYEDEGFVSVTMYSYPPPYVNEPSIRRLWTKVNRPEMFAQENVYFTDCLLRHMHEYRFIAHYDPDEVPILLKYDSYTHFLEKQLLTAKLDMIKKKQLQPPGYLLHWNIFYDDSQVSNTTRNIPKYLYMLRHNLTPKKELKATPGTFKALYDMDFVTGVYSHNILICAAGPCPGKVTTIPTSDAYLAHFTWTCGSQCQNSSDLREEERLLRHRMQVQSAVEKVLKTLDIF